MRVPGKLLQTFLNQEDSPTFVEYGLLVVLIALLIVLSATLMGQSISGIFSRAATYF